MELAKTTGAPVQHTMSVSARRDRGVSEGKVGEGQAEEEGRVASPTI
jgi:hypothetical protein